MMNVEGMRRRAFWRWRSFWLGVLVLALTGWTWWRSMSCIDSIGYTTGVWTWELSNSDGRVGALWGDYTFTDGPFEFSFGLPKRFDAPVLAEAMTFERSGKDVMGRCLVAWWVVVLLEVVAWVWMLGWRWRKMGTSAAVGEMGVGEG